MASRTAQQRRQPVRNKQLPEEVSIDQFTKRVPSTLTLDHSKKQESMERKRSKARKRSKKKNKLAMKPSERRKARQEKAQAREKQQESKTGDKQSKRKSLV